ncbi:hypothetical protein ACHMWN_04320 [Pedobacter sp. UC225_61]|uniref:hypothetical protein n=1 Tax=Pedobacter sp. UC225_61 TaxID=3374623 RepID=UPI00378AD694
MSTAKGSPQLRLKVFAGPNGSGKSTVIKGIMGSKVGGKKIDFGVYVNADDIAKKLSTNAFSFKPYAISATLQNILDFAQASGLLMPGFEYEDLQSSIEVSGDKVLVIKAIYSDRIAQLIARFLREGLLAAKKRFSFETVFSHESNIEFMEKAKAEGYKVYLYFVSTESPEINKFRVKLRVKQGGHDVPEDKIKSRYYRSLELLYDAAEVSYQSYFFDNSGADEPFKLSGHFKVIDNEKVWDEVEEDNVAGWFKKYYIGKQPSI